MPQPKRIRTRTAKIQGKNYHPYNNNKTINSNSNKIWNLLSRKQKAIKVTL